MRENEELSESKTTVILFYKRFKTYFQSKILKYKIVKIDFSLTVKAATFIFISGRGSVLSPT